MKRVMHSRRNHIRKSSGSYIAETGAALIIILPVAIMGTLFASEIAQVYMIKQALASCADTAARRLAIQYGSDPNVVNNAASTQFQNITFLNIVKSTSQFAIPSGSGGWNLNSNPRTVTVEVTYFPGRYGCPEVSRLSQWSTITERATHTLEGY